ncbi:MAG: cytochrome c maturation protein CcmE [Porticoccus sp.]
MHPIRKQRLVAVLFIVFFASVAVGLLSYALRDNINLFYPPSKLASGEAPVGKHIRAGGCVWPGSVERSNDSLDVSFLITDGSAQVRVTYSGVLPDLFGEGEAIVANGQMGEDGVFLATEVLAKHDENYTPPEVTDAVQLVQGIQYTKGCEGLNYDS